eukprot:CAMPEP_0168336432 /NCGR_PEP_ID=MMETSP0213-20121227/11538_1 /TAXON_ID=151035 /ORGANISM="Euplotes harpa, Strain FSP1.4" /LENGTH=226 /DNA_ID=CAMNT_0008341623 /DNA_START=1572 /DNA_END=2252 /DNA_ORIENTATION=-
MWGDTKWMSLKDALIRASLLVYKTDNNGSFVYSMLPFMSVRAYELLETNEDRKTIYHLKCCKLFKDYCYTFYQSDKSLDKIEKFIDQETNIWACIYRSCNKKRDIAYVKNNQSDSESDFSDDEAADKVPKSKDTNDIAPDESAIKDKLKDSVSQALKMEETPHRGVGAGNKRYSVMETIRQKPMFDRISVPIGIDSKDKLIEEAEYINKFYDEEMLVVYYTIDLIM